MYPREAIEAWLRSSGHITRGKSDLHPLDELIDIVFFASLEKEESAPTHVRVVYHEHGVEGLKNLEEARFVANGQTTMPAWQVLEFEPADGVTDLTVKTLAKIAPAASLPRTAVVVGSKGGQLKIEGLARRVDHAYFPVKGEEEVLVLCASKPGQLVLLHGGSEVFRYENGRIVEIPRRPSLFELLRNEKSMIRAALTSICTKTINKLPRQSIIERDSYPIVANVVMGLVEQMSEGNHGGLIAILPNAKDIDNEIAAGKYRFVSEHRSAITAKVAELAKSRANNSHRAWQWKKPETPDEEFERAVDDADEEKAKNDLKELVQNIGRLSNIDNALLLGPDLEVLCAGYSITPDPDNEKIPDVYEADTLEGTPGISFPLLRHGSRHRAAANFAHRFPGGLAFLYSQDGDLRCLHRPIGQKHVLLWNISSSEW